MRKSYGFLVAFVFLSVFRASPALACQDQRCMEELFNDPVTYYCFDGDANGRWCAIPPNSNISCNEGSCTSTPPTPPGNPVDNCNDGQVIPTGPPKPKVLSTGDNCPNDPAPM